MFYGKIIITREIHNTENFLLLCLPTTTIHTPQLVLFVSFDLSFSEIFSTVFVLIDENIEIFFNIYKI